MPYDRPKGERDWGLLRRFGVEFRRCRLYAGISQVELARRSGVSQSTISRIERGKAASASLIKLVRISEAMRSGFPFGFCPHPHFCAWNRLDEDGRTSVDPRRPFTSDELLEDIRLGRGDG
jgi:transcriptional regulator with XRE-family HTH domain